MEAKLADTDVSPNLTRFQTMLEVPAIQLVNCPGIARTIKTGSHKMLVVTASR